MRDLCFWPGRGEHTYSDDRKYDGEWKDGAYHGKGTLTFADEGKYVGNWKYGKKHGQGTLSLANGKIRDGLFLDDKFYGEEKLHQPVAASPTAASNPTPAAPKVLQSDRDVALDSGSSSVNYSLEADKTEWMRLGAELKLSDQRAGTALTTLICFFMFGIPASAAFPPLGIPVFIGGVIAGLIWWSEGKKNSELILRRHEIGKKHKF